MAIYPMKLLNTATCWSEEGPFRIIQISKKQIIVGYGRASQTPKLYDQGLIRFHIALDGFGKGAKVIERFIEEHFVAEIQDTHGQVFWRNDTPASEPTT